jgi:Ni/Fe-hydrogenase 1 B-type cytochrome subunit
MSTLASPTSPTSPTSPASPASAATLVSAIREPVYVWDVIVRLTHWVVFFAIIILSVTGFYIGSPFIISTGPATQAFVMGWMRIVHFYASIFFVVALMVRAAWMFVGPPTARWNNFIPTTRERWQNLWGTFKFYTFITTKPPPSVGHNAMAGAAYLAVFGLYAIMIGTGLALYGVDAHLTSYMSFFDRLLPIFGGAQSARWLHHIGMWLILGFAIQHIYSSILMSKVEKDGTIDSIFSGYKVVKRRGVKPRG